MAGVSRSFDRDKLVRLYASGKSCQDAADACGVPMATAYAYLKGAGLVRRKMATKTLRSNRAVVLAMYRNDPNTQRIATKYGVDIGTVIKFLRDHGFDTRRRNEIEKRTTDAKVVKKYIKGASENRISIDLGVSRTAVRRALERTNTPIRGSSDAEKAKWKSKVGDRGHVEKQCGEAWKTRTGPIGKHEREIVECIKRQGVDASPQFRIAPYNVDFAIESCRVAVEVQRSRMGTGSMRSDRLKHILDAGWSILIVWTPKAKAIDCERAAERCIAFAEIASQNQSSRGCYGVIDGNGESASPRSFKFNDGTRVPGF